MIEAKIEGEGVAAAMATREPGAMSHHKAHQTSVARCRNASYSYSTAPAPSVFRLRALLSLLVLVVTWTSLLGAATARETLHDRQRRSGSLLAVPVDQDIPAWKGPSLLVIDTRPPPIAPFMHLQRRQDEKPSSTETKTASTSKASVHTDPSAAPTDFAIPQPFDTALSNNFTTTCAAFFSRLLTDNDLKQCRPFSLMLQTSSDFFDVSKSFVRITQTLEATCAVNESSCTQTMNSMARELIAQNNCGVDYQNDNPQVLQAYNGLIAYEPLYQASCLRDDEGSYCFANAVTNASSTTDSYPYYLPLGTSLIGGARPTCNSCLQDAMAIFSSFAGNSTQPISKTYNGAASILGISCGTGFVNQTATPLKGAASAMSPSLTPIIALAIMLLLCFVQ